MCETSTYPLRLPKSLNDEVAKIAKREHTSVNQFIALAVAEKISPLETELLFTNRLKKSRPGCLPKTSILPRRRTASPG